MNATTVDVRSRMMMGFRHYVALTKPRLSSLVVFTTAGGMWLGRGDPSSWQYWTTLLATSCVVGAANALNCYIERDRDALMTRTASRPLPAGRLEPEAARWFGIALACISIPTLIASSNLLTAALALLAFVSYVFAYTPMKSKSAWAMWMGALPGALPPLMGWTAVTGRVEWPGVVLFAILFLWQLPHFLSIALFRKEEYRRAGLLSVPLVHGDDAARIQAAVLSFLLIPVSLAIIPLGVAGIGYGVVVSILGLVFFGMAAWGVWKKGDVVWARKFFGLSLVYLSGLFLALGLDVAFRG